MAVILIVLILAFTALALLDVFFQKKPDVIPDCYFLFDETVALNANWIFAILCGATLITELASAIFLSQDLILLWEIAGALIAVCGGVILYLGLSKRYYSWWTDNLKGDEVHLVRDGIFTYSRNPEFAGTALFHIGMCIALQSLYALPVAVATIVAGLFAVNRKEHSLSEVFGFDELIKRTNMLWGKRKYPLTAALCDDDEEWITRSAADTADDEETIPDTEAEAEATVSEEVTEEIPTDEE